MPGPGPSDAVQVIADEHGIDPTGTLDHVLWNRKEMKKDPVDKSII